MTAADEHIPHESRAAAPERRVRPWSVALAVLLFEAAWLLGVAYAVWRLVAAAA